MYAALSLLVRTQRDWFTQFDRSPFDFPSAVGTFHRAGASGDIRFDCVDGAAAGDEAGGVSTQVPSDDSWDSREEGTSGAAGVQAARGGLGLAVAVLAAAALVAAER